MPTEIDYLKHDIKYTLIVIEETKQELAKLENDLKEAESQLRKLSLKII